MSQDAGGRCHYPIIVPPGIVERMTTDLLESAADLRATALRRITVLVGAYLALSVLTLVAIILMRDDAAIVTDAVWVRGTIVVGSAALMFAFALRAMAGSRMGWIRVRLISAIMLVAIAVIISLPGLFPIWMRLEQAACGVILLFVVITANGRHLRSAFAKK
jgi:hypothetical protein